MTARLAKFAAIATLITSIAAIAAGCGEDEPASSATSGQSSAMAVTTSSLDKAEFIKQAEAACVQKGTGSLEKVENYLDKHRSTGLSTVELYTHMFKDLLIPIVEEQTAAVRAIGAPEEEEEDVEAILSTQQEAIDEAKKDKKLGSMEEFESHFIQATKDYEAFGFKAACMIAGWV